MIKKIFRNLLDIDIKVIKVTWDFKGGERVSIYPNKKTYMYYRTRYKHIAVEKEYKIVRLKLSSNQKKDLKEIGEVWID